jgi:hypothetical protein
MRIRLAWALLVPVALIAGSAALAAPGQDRPGQPTQARVWVENRGRNEAVPVVLQEGVQLIGTPTVQIGGTPTVAIAPTTIVQARLARQPWEYRTLPVAPGQDVAKLLLGAGQEGWEVTGLQVADQSGSALLLKRPR